MLCLSGFELYSRWVGLEHSMRPKQPASFASFERNSTGNSVRVVVSEIFVALILVFLIFKSCV